MAGLSKLLPVLWAEVWGGLGEVWAFISQLPALLGGSGGVGIRSVLNPSSEEVVYGVVVTATARGLGGAWVASAETLEVERSDRVEGCLGWSGFPGMLALSDGRCLHKLVWGIIYSVYLWPA